MGRFINGNGSNRAKRYYTDYVAHMIRFYLNNRSGITVKGLSHADVSNWVSVQTVFSYITQEERDVLTALYTGEGTYSDIMERYCDSHELEVQTGWNIVKSVSEDIAKVRGLI